jgi:hypothetical protein
MLRVKNPLLSTREHVKSYEIMFDVQERWEYLLAQQPKSAQSLEFDVILRCSHFLPDIFIWLFHGAETNV